MFFGNAPSFYKVLRKKYDNGTAAIPGTNLSISASLLHVSLLTVPSLVFFVVREDELGATPEQIFFLILALERVIEMRNEVMVTELFSDPTRRILPGPDISTDDLRQLSQRARWALIKKLDEDVPGIETAACTHFEDR